MFGGEKEDDTAPRINFVPCLTWVRRGVAKPEPEKVKLTKEELIEVIKQTKADIAELEEEDESTPETGESMEDSAEKAKPVDPSRVKSDEEIEAEYGLDDYDNEEEDAPRNVLGLGDLTVYADRSEDPYIDPEQPDEDEDDEEDFKIRGTDNLILVGHVEGECSTLEVYIYNDVEDALYIHHDIILPSFPLALEWLSFDPESDTKGSLVAVGTMLPEIQVWDLDIVDCLEPAFTLGRKGKKKKGIPGIGHKDAVLALAWNTSVQHILASGSVDQTVMIWDLNQKNVASTLKFHKEKVQGLAWHPYDNQTLATGCCDKFVRVVDCRTVDSFKKWKVTGEVESVLWDHFNPYQCIVSTDAGTVHGIDVRNDDLSWTLAAHTEDVTGISLSSQCPGCLVSVSSDKTVKVWDITGNKPEFVMEKQANLGLLQTVKGCPDAPFVVAVGGDKQSDNFKVMDIRENAQVRQRFGTRVLQNPLKTADFGYQTANDAEPENEMDTESAADVFQTMSLESGERNKPSEPTKSSGGASSKFNKDKKRKKKKEF